MREKRNYMRFDVLMEAFFGKNNDKKHVTVKNFSRDGLGVASGENIKRGENVEIEMLIPGDNIPVIVTGEIAWTIPQESGSKVHEGGVKIKQIKSDDRSRILNYIYTKWMKSKTDSKTEEI